MAFHTWIYILIGHCFYFMIRMAMSDTTRQEEKDAQQKAIDEAVADVTLSYEIKLSRAQSMIKSLRETRDRLERQLTNLSQSKEELAKKKGKEIEKLKSKVNDLKCENMRHLLNLEEYKDYVDIAQFQRLKEENQALKSHNQALLEANHEQAKTIDELEKAKVRRRKEYEPTDDDIAFITRNLDLFLMDRREYEPHTEYA